MLTNNAIARWLGELKDEGGGRLIMNDTPVSEILAFEEENNITEFISKDTKLIDVLNRYESINIEGKKINAFLITEKGRKNDSIIGIITNWDIPKIYGELEI